MGFLFSWMLWKREVAYDSRASSSSEHEKDMLIVSIKHQTEMVCVLSMAIQRKGQLRDLKELEFNGHLLTHNRKLELLEAQLAMLEMNEGGLVLGSDE